MPEEQELAVLFSLPAILCNVAGSGVGAQAISQPLLVEISVAENSVQGGRNTLNVAQQ